MNGLTTTLIYLLIFVAIFYFLLIRPQQKRAKEAREMQSGLSRGDKIVTIGGLQGTIESMDEQIIVLKSSGSKLTFERNAIRSVLKKSNSQDAHPENEVKKGAESKEK